MYFCTNFVCICTFDPPELPKYAMFGSLKPVGIYITNSRNFLFYKVV